MLFYLIFFLPHQVQRRVNVYKRDQCPSNISTPLGLYNTTWKLGNYIRLVVLLENHINGNNWNGKEKRIFHAWIMSDPPIPSPQYLYVRSCNGSKLYCTIKIVIWFLYNKTKIVRATMNSPRWLQHTTSSTGKEKWNEIKHRTVLISLMNDGTDDIRNE